ncbi:DUF1501 domain-containing protein [Luteimonas aquatica]|uniref:DUF1501 domain-containing protein n=1 Tax=Luteimonas aquatica TaxID=450364 RepID=UPI001F5A4660|nr:DUF1501 domain-containing protein [Luteimonas aquatica]
MSRLILNRREFLKGCCATATAGAAGPALLFSDAAFAAANPYDTVVHVFLRGGIDGLNLVPPVSGDDRSFYEQARPNLALPASGAYAALPLTLANGAATGFGLHPSASGLRDIWNDGRLAIVQSCGLLTAVTRSHFDAQLYLDLGTPGQHGTGSGWITRAWNTQPGTIGNETMPALAVNSRTPANLLGAAQALTMGSPQEFALNASAWAWQRRREGDPAGYRGISETLASLWAGGTALETSGQRADLSLRVIAAQPYSDPPAGWPATAFARQLWTVAQSIRFNLGMRYAALDLGGWDTHEGQGSAGSGYHYFQNKVAELSQALTAFYAELKTGGELPRVTVIVQSEFGRRVRENGSGGTDHGYGNPLLVLGGAVNGRKLYGTWKGLDPEVLSSYFGDVPVTTDFRRVLSELLIQRMGNNQIGTVFPGYAGYAPLGLFAAGTLAAAPPTASLPARTGQPPSSSLVGTAPPAREHAPQARRRLLWRLLAWLERMFA